MQLQHVPRTASVAGAVGRVREHGYVSIDELVPAATMTQIDSELEAHLAASPYGENDGVGKLTLNRQLV